MSLLSRVGVFGEHNEFGGCLVLASAYFFLKIILHTHDVHGAQGVHGVCAWCAWHFFFFLYLARHCTIKYTLHMHSTENGVAGGGALFWRGGGVANFLDDVHLVCIWCAVAV